MSRRAGSTLRTAQAHDRSTQVEDTRGDRVDMNAPAELTPEVLAQRQREVVQALMAVLPTHCLLYREEDTVAVRMRRPRRLPAPAARGRVAGNGSAGAAHRADLPRGSTCRSCRAAPAPACRAARCRSGMASCCRSRASARSSKSIRMRAPRPCSRACAISRSPKPPRLTACTTRPIRRRRSPARSAATSPRIPAACIA